MVGMLACLVLWGIYQVLGSTGGWLDLLPALLVSAVAGAVSVVAGRPAHAAWNGALAGLAGLLVPWVVINLVMGYTAPVWTAEFAMYLGAMALLLGAPYLAGYLLSWVVERSRSSRGTATSRA
jgi:hypothetical protein